MRYSNNDWEMLMANSEASLEEADIDATLEALYGPVRQQVSVEKVPDNDRSGHRSRTSTQLSESRRRA